MFTIGVQVGAYQLKIGRPKGYTGGGMPPGSSSMPVGTPIIGIPGLSGLPSLGASINPLLAAAPSISSLTSSHNNTVAMITNLPIGIAAEQVKELVSPFGELKAFNCIKSPSVSGQATQTAIFEYKEPKIIDLAVIGLSNIDLLGNRLMVQKIPPQAAEMLLKPISAITSSPSNAKASSISLDSKDSDSNNSGHTLNDQITPTRVVRLSNMTTDEELRDDELYQDLVEDIRDECSNHGKVVSVNIPRGSKASNNFTESDDGVGYVFVEFESIEDASKGYAALKGRKFNKQLIGITYYPIDLYFQKVYALPSGFIPS